MEFINRMKKREFFEMVLKMLSAVFVAMIAIILMEGMIYAIELNAYRNYSSTSLSVSSSTILYCIEESEDQYFVLFYNEGVGSEWSALGSLETKAEIEARKSSEEVADIVWHAPSAFIFSITPVHYVVMVVFMLVVVGYFVYKFIRLNSQYNEIVSNFQKTGEIEIEI